MESKVNYAIVGLFVIGLTAALIIITLWLSVGTSNKHYRPFVVYVNESVAGLSNDAPVKYNGVNVGYVSDISLNPQNPQQVILTLQIEQGVNVSIDTKASIMVQGITGIAYVGLKGGNPQSPPLVASIGQPYPVIKTEPSFLFRLDTAIQQLSMTMTSLSNNINSLLDSENQKAVKNTLANLEKLSQSLTITGTQTNTALQNLTNQTLPQATATLTNLQGLLIHLQHLTHNVEQNPSILLRGQQPLPTGPGE